MNHCSCEVDQDNGREPYALYVRKTALINQNFRTAIWTGRYLQMTVMCIAPQGEIGMESHSDTDQFIRIECGTAIVMMGECKTRLEYCRQLGEGDGVFVPAGMWHNIKNPGNGSLKISSIYAPPHHPKGTVQRLKADVQSE